MPGESALYVHRMIRPVAVAAGGCAILVLFWTLGGYVLSVRASESGNTFVGQHAADGVQRSGLPLYLYFADRTDRFLHAERRVTDRPRDAAAFGRAIVQALIAGPHGDLLPTLPAGTALRAFFIYGHRAVVDLSASLREHFPGSGRTELLAVFSIVDSLVFNIGQVETVTLLVDGSEAVTLAGHIDLSRPFAADMLLVR